MWTLLPSPFPATEPLSAALGILQIRTPTTAWDMVIGGTLPTKFVLLVLLAFSLLTNMAAGLSTGPLDHAEVLAMGQHAGARLRSLLKAVVTRI